METKTVNIGLRALKKAILIILLNLSFSTFAQQPSIQVNFSSTTNAINETSSGISNGVNTYKTYTITIPFFSSSLDQLNFLSGYYCSGGKTLINVNGVNSSYLTSHPSTFALHKFFQINNLAVGISSYTIKSYCNGVEIPNSRQLIKVIIVNEVSPLLNLTLSNSCQINTHTGLFTGLINLNANGNFTNGNNLYLKTTDPLNTCNLAPKKLTDLTTITNTISNDIFYTCNANKTYTVELIYKNIGLFGNQIIYTIPSGTYGWTNYIYKIPLKGSGCFKKEARVIRKF